MTRIIPAILGEQATQSAPVSRSSIRLSIPLKLITPMVGGGVVSKIIDKNQPIRAAAIRGVLRYWWRTLQSDIPTVKQLYAREQRIWGGQTPDAKSGLSNSDGKSLKGRVSLRIDTVSAGDFIFQSPGKHRFQNNGNRAQHKIAADWNVKNIKNPGYVLFPLQYSSSDLKSFGDYDVLLPDLAVVGRFNLIVDLNFAVRESDENYSESAQYQQQIDLDMLSVICAIKAWTTLGGVGARTRRGFGSIEINGSPAITVYSKFFEQQGQQYKELLETSIFPDTLQRELVRLVDIQRVTTSENTRDSAEIPAWPVISKSIPAVVGAVTGAAEVALDDLINKSMAFYQRFPDGRNKSTNGKMVGTSRWPEGDVMKYMLRRNSRSSTVKFNHEPEITQIEQLSAPRAARGLPLLISFVNRDRLDAAADGELLPIDGDRLPSPLIFRALRDKNGKYKPVAIRLQTPALKNVRINLGNSGNDENIDIPVKAVSTITTAEGETLCKEGADAVTAFFSYLCSKGYT